MTTALPSAISQASQLATRVALLDAAERLFSQNGIEGTSVREIIKAAGANLGAINYHFGTKDRLALEVFARRLEPVKPDREGFIQRVISFVAAGLSAPMPKQLRQPAAKARQAGAGRRPSKTKP